MRRGFSLLETVMAAFIFLTALALIAGVWPAYSRAAAKNAGYLAAMDIASQEIEVSIAQGYDGVGDRSGDVVVTNIVEGQSVDRQFHYEVAVSDVTPTLRDVTVTVTWTDLTGDQEIRFETLITS